MQQRRLTYFISDLHLGAGYIPDPRAHELAITSWLRQIAPTAKRLYLLGDIFDYWYEYRTVAPRGHVRFLGALAELADSGVEITWLKGNHDIWIFDYLPSEIGLTVVDGILDTTIDNHRFVMEHGDGVGELRPLYRLMRRLFRNKIAQKLYAAIHPRWTIGFAHRWSRHSRLNSSMPQATQLPDDDPLIKFANDYTNANGHIDFFIFGHRHLRIDREILKNTRLVILGEAYCQMTYAVFDGQKITLKTIEN